MPDQDYISEEIEIGSGTTGSPESSSLGTSVVRPVVTLPTGSASAPEQVEIGQYRPSVPSVNSTPTIGAVVTAPDEFGPSPVQPARVVSASPTTEELMLVASNVNKKCLPISEIMELTGLSRDKVVACLDALMSDEVGTVVEDAGLYCGFVTVSRLQKQLQACRACIGED